MPAFIKTPQDEKRWEDAKKAANKTLSEADGDQYWALTNSIYQKMIKSEKEIVEQFTSILKKAREKIYDPNEEAYGDEDAVPLEEQFTEFDPGTEASAGEDWLKDNDPQYGKEGEGEYVEYGDSEDEEAHRAAIDEDMGEDVGTKEQTNPIKATKQRDPAAEEEKPQGQEEVKSSRFRQPSKEELVAMRAHTRPWEQRARETNMLNADPAKNPELAHRGKIVEARNEAHGDRNAAYMALINSDTYKNADLVTQMEMDDKFEADWRANNQGQIKAALENHNAAHKKGLEGHDKHDAEKEAKIQNIIAGGAQSPEAFSTEEGLQHAGGVRGEEGTQGTIAQDPAAAFAMGNQEFIRQFAQDRASKNKAPTNVEDMGYDEGVKKDINRILGPAMQKNPQFEKFFAEFHPLIGMNAHKAIRSIGLDPQSPDIDMSMLHEAGMHGLIQSINDYDHENPNKATFATHAGNKIRGLQMTALKNQDQIPAEMRRAQKEFNVKKQVGAQVSSPTEGKVKTMLAQSPHPKAPDISDRLKRVDAQRQAQAIRRPASEVIQTKQKAPIAAPPTIPEGDEE